LLVRAEKVSWHRLGVTQLKGGKKKKKYANAKVRLTRLREKEVPPLQEKKDGRDREKQCRGVTRSEICSYYVRPWDYSRGRTEKKKGGGK